MSIETKLQKLVDIKKDIKSALEEKNRTPTNEFSTYANEIRSLITGGATILNEGKAAVQPAKKYDTLYFDTSLTNEEVESILSPVPLATQNIENFLYACGNADLSLGFSVIVYGHIDVGFLIFFADEINGTDTPIYASNTEMLANLNFTERFIGWNPEFDGMITISSDYTTPVDSLEETIIGAQNKLIRDLFFVLGETKKLQGTYDGASLKVNNTYIDISSLLDQKKLPLNINVVDNNLVAENIAEGVNILGVIGTHTCVVIPTVTDLVVSQEGIATWTAPDITSLAEYNPVISYLVSVNSKEAIETSDTTLNLKTSLDNGTNNISIIVKAILTNNKDTSTTIEYSKPGTITTLSTGLSNARFDTSAAAVGTDIYICGGHNQWGDIKQILKFDTTTKIITVPIGTLSSEVSGTSAAAVGNNIYIFGGNNGSNFFDLIQKFDTTTKTTTTLNATLPLPTSHTSAAAVGNNIYIFGGYTADGRLNTILKFDTTTETITTLSETLFSFVSGTSAAAVENNIYIFGGYGTTCSNVIQKFDTTTETRTKLSTTLPLIASNTSAAAVENNIYIFGGYTGNGSLNTILKFDTTTETITTLSTTLPSEVSHTSAAAVGNNIYIFGGHGATDYATIVKYTTE